MSGETQVEAMFPSGLAGCVRSVYDRFQIDEGQSADRLEAALLGNLAYALPR